MEKEEETIERVDSGNERSERVSTWRKIWVGIAAVAFLYLFYITLDANKYKATVLVVAGEGKVGINPTTEVLDFGDLSPGTQAVRRVQVENGTPIPMYVFAVRFGDVNDLMKLDKNYFVLPGNHTERIEFTVYMPASAPVGQRLNGRVYLFKVPGPWRQS